MGHIKQENLRMKELKCWGLVPASGIGYRLGSAIPKQYINLLGKPLICHTLDTLINCKYLSGIIVGISKQDRYWKKIVENKVKVLSTYYGGSSRAETVQRGLQFMETYVRDEDHVLIHDAVRPCVRLSDIEKLIMASREGDAGAILAVKAVVTIKKGGETGLRSFVRETIPRKNLWHAQTPQVFPYKILRDAFEIADIKNISDESSVMEEAGHKPHLVAGHSDNIKVTTAVDLDLAKVILSERYGEDL